LERVTHELILCRVYGTEFGFKKLPSETSMVNLT
jgi:hypothetical protein